ncbi:uncharacterized protein ARMOST_01609 [Armillaria ostoyae]|uniref:Uncharacterized protein n=1 Tax=Armillaria ostoyae TaxID=47428 RepID=A0A284QPD0_ARMOS|nr:uncharacterized protein ARMOST_01609 [Armillaria ostoyae]
MAFSANTALRVVPLLRFCVETVDVHDDSSNRRTQSQPMSVSSTVYNKRADIPSDLTDDDKALLFQILDAQLNSTILYALLHGIYTGILVVTLWTIFINKYWPIRRASVIVIILLHALITIGFAATWSYIHSAFIPNGQSLWTIYLKISSVTQAAYWEMGIAVCMSTILADLYMIWCCWTVWERRWLVVLLPVISLASAIVSRTIKVYYDYVHAPADVFDMLYISFNLATALSCTLLIIYRIATVAGVSLRALEGQLRVYHRFIEVLVESSALYSISLILDLALTIRGGLASYYLDVIASIVKRLAPILLIGRAAAGHTRPKDDCEESAVSTLRFQTPSELCTTNFQESTIQSAVPELPDIEAQPGTLVVFVERTQSSR